MPSMRSSKSHTAMLHLLPLLLSIPAVATACSCAPSRYTFRLSLDNDCSINDIVDNDGIKESLCFVERDVSLPTANKKRSGVSGAVKMVDRSSGSFGRQQNIADSSNTTDSSTSSQEQIRNLQSSSSPVEILSIQYLEFDNSNSLNVIYTNDEYVDTSLGNGDEFTFQSSTASSNGDVEVVGGASLILYGKTSDGEIVRNRFFWLYENCEGALTGVEESDEIGWVALADIAGPSIKNCPAVPETSPTISPRTKEPAPTPSDGNVDWMTPFPTPGNEGGSDDKVSGTDDIAGTTNDDVDDDNNTGSGDDTSADGTDDASDSSDEYGPPSNKSAKTNKPYYRPKGYQDVAPGGKTNKHPYDSWSQDGGSKSAKAFGKSGNSGKSTGKSLKGGSGYIDHRSDDDYPRDPRLFSESSHNGENVR